MPFCSECGSDIGSTKFCGNCGAPTINSNSPKSIVQTSKQETSIPAKEINIAEFTDGFGCNVKLTSERIYAKSIGLEETYALRSVDGAGVFDDMELFAKEKLEAENSARAGKIGGGILILCGIAFFFSAMEVSDPGLPILLSLVFIGFGIFLINNASQKVAKVKLRSYIKIIISGSNKLYLFDKNAPDSEKIAEFLEKVEETLTKYS